jgi:hypothetical protein
MIPPSLNPKADDAVKASNLIAPDDSTESSEPFSSNN